MKTIKFLSIILLIFCIFEVSSYAKEKKAPNISIGTAGFGGINNAVASDGPNEFKAGAGYGAGIIVEAMFSNLLGIHSGLWFTEGHSEHYFRGVVTKWVDFRGREFGLPIYMIIAFNKGLFTFNILAGIKVAYIFQAELFQNDSILGESSVDITDTIGHYQAGPGFGLNFKFQIGKFFDIFFGVAAEIYITDLILESGDDKTYDHAYNAKFMLGFLFRTNIYPMKKKSL